MVYFKQPAINGTKACRLGVVLQQSLTLSVLSQDFVGCCLQGQFEIMQWALGYAAMVGGRKSEFTPGQGC